MNIVNQMSINTLYMIIWSDCVPWFLQLHIHRIVPKGSKYGIFTYIYHKFKPNVGKYTSPMDPMGYVQ